MCNPITWWRCRTQLATTPGYNLGTFNGQSSQASIRIEGHDATPKALSYDAMAQPGVDAIEEVAFQTSNYAAEFGTTGSVLMNFTMKSGTNQYHGTGYDYFVNEALNAGNPYSLNTSGTGKVRPTARRNDFGGTLGGQSALNSTTDTTRRSSSSTTRSTWRPRCLLERIRYPRPLI
jgi:hypothetical protein